MPPRRPLREVLRVEPGSRVNLGAIDASARARSTTFRAWSGRAPSFSYTADMFASCNPQPN